LRLSAAIALLLSVGCAREPAVGERIEGEAQGVGFVLRLAVRIPETERAEVASLVASALDRVLPLASTALPESDASRLNRAEAGAETPVSIDTFTIVQEGVRASELTFGAFDLTAAPLARLWGIGGGLTPSGNPPIEEALDRERARVGFRNLALDDDAMEVTKRIGSLEVDLGGLAVGHALDRAAAMLDERGYKDYLLEAQLKVRTRGKDPEGRPWLVPIVKPGPGRGEIQRSLPLSGFAMATVGDSRGTGDAEELAGKLHPHLVDPRTGRPLDHGLLSVTVVGEKCLSTEAMATGLLVLGPEKGLEVAAAQDLAALFLVRSEKGTLEEKASPAFAELFF
jgi:thiamine biosynthesis lipoprotein